MTDQPQPCPKCLGRGAIRVPITRQIRISDTEVVDYPATEYRHCPVCRPTTEDKTMTDDHKVSAPQTGWCQMATAPMDGSDVLIRTKQGAISCKWDSVELEWVAGWLGVSLLHGDATGWMLAPTPTEHKRQPPATGYHPDAALNLHYVRSRGYYPKFNEALAWRGISANQAREAAHLLNQLAEYLEHADK